MKKILQLTTYPLVNPVHGGQIRASEIKKFLISMGAEVVSCAVCEPAHDRYGEHDILVSYEELNNAVNVPLNTDFATSVVCDKGAVYKKLADLCRQEKPDTVFIEQSWLWTAVKKMLSDGVLPSETKIVYSSHNIESRMKNDMLNHHGIDAVDRETVVKAVENIEKELCVKSFAVITCTSSDESYFRSLGAELTYVCPNGVAHRSADPEKVAELKKIIGGTRYAFFIGSGHPPNAIGFWEMFGDSLAWLAPDQIIISAGGVCSLLEKYMPETAAVYRDVNFDRNKLIWGVSNEELAALIDCANVIILPITLGGGSNLKTAEAIAALKPVVATSVACRGFDFVSELSHFHVEDNPKLFCDRIKYYLSRDVCVKPDETESALRETVYWEHCLDAMKKMFA
jgi:glycosyltransferase involved in cell wall biosynthesis